MNGAPSPLSRFRDFLGNSCLNMFVYILSQLSEVVDRKLFCSTSITFLKNGPGMSLNRGVSVALRDIEVVPFLSYILRTPKEKKAARSIGCLSVDDY